jgi:aminoglycoside phosphotransferase (APT) family kinase protein
MVVRQELVALLRRWLPGKDLVIDRANSGGSTEVYRVAFDHEIAWLRLAENPGEDWSVEYVVHDRLRAMGARVPDILMFEVAPPELDRSAALTGTIPGIPLSECRDQAIAANVAYAAGEDLARINAIEVSGYGWIDRLQAGEPEIVAEHPARSAWAAEYATATDKVIANAILPAALAESLQQVMIDWCEHDPGSVPSHLAHGDFDATHIYVDPGTGEYTGIIDFGEGRGAEIEYDLGHALLHDGELDRPAIFDALARSWSGGRVDERLAHRIRTQAIAIGMRRLAIMHDRGQTQTAYGSWLTRRLGEFLPSIT